MYPRYLYIIQTILVLLLSSAVDISYAQLRTRASQMRFRRTILMHAIAQDSVKISTQGLVLIADSGSLMHDVDFSISVLRDKQVAPLQSNMVNLTGGAPAYRLLPHGEHFSTPAQLELTYDPTALPQGFYPEDIYTYYYNEEHKRWIKLERLWVDTLHHVVMSHTTHFTDFINAVVRTPDLPEVNTFVPTLISDLEEVHPMQHLTMIAAPQVNNYGVAQITYPIELPSGRNGLQPDLALMYSSTNGNGLLGYGWYLPQPAITIDTRWGVPRYDQVNETEIYSINGTQCVLKDGNPNLKLSYQTNVFIPRQNGSVQFIARDVKNCDRIVRHGRNPKEYWWEVIGRNGSVSYYGKYANDTAVNHNCVLTDEQGNIGYWALAEVVDLSGNYILYEYLISPNREIYPKRIFYTGHRDSENLVDLEPSYRVFFHYDQRSDILRDGRLGFVRQTDSILCYIDVAFQEHESRNISAVKCTNHRFFLLYNDSSSVSLLSRIQDHINYFDAPWPTNGTCYSPGAGDKLNGEVAFEYNNPSLTTIFEGEDVVLPYPNHGEKYLNTSKGFSWNVGGTATAGFGRGVWNTNLSVGGNYNFSKSRSTTDQLILDMDGDGLADLVYIQNDTIYYCPQLYDFQGPRFGDAINTRIPAKGLSHEHSMTHSWGLQVGVEVPEIINANVSGGKEYVSSITESFFSDINGDGLPDYVNNGKVYFNRLQSHQDFLEHSGSTEVMIDSSHCTPFYYDGEVEVLPDFYEYDTIVASFVFNPDCSLGFHGYTPDSLPPIHLDTIVHCEDCNTLIRDFILSGNCPIELYNKGSLRDFIFTNSILSDSLFSDSLIFAMRDSVRHRGNRMPYEDIYDCLKYCNAELPCEECLDAYLYGTWEEYEACKSYSNCRTLCSTCVHHLFEGNDHGYLQCMNDSCLGGTLYTISTPCTDCEETCIQDVNACRECIEANLQCMVCEECEQACALSLDDCLECKRQYNCLGGYDDKCYYCCSGNDAGSSTCGECMYNHGYYCAECADICYLHPELCSQCVNNHCYYDETITYLDECMAHAQSVLNQWKNNIQQQYGNVYFVQAGNTWYAHKIDTIYPASTDPDIEAVRVWVAPRTGVVTVKSYIQLIQDTTYSRLQTRQADGVKCVIQHHHNVYVDSITHTLHATSDDILNSEIIAPNDYQPHDSTYFGIVVSKGDIFFFRLRSVRTHNFDNVDWLQTIVYENENSSYYSYSDFICSSDQLFQEEHSGTITLNTDIVCPPSKTASLAILVDNQVIDSVEINAAVSHSHKVFAYSGGSYVSLRLSSTSPSSLGQIEVRPYLSFVPAQPDSTNRSYGLWLAPHVNFIPEVILDSTYYHLFGPLYRGWGQFGYNNVASTDKIPLHELSNKAIEFLLSAPTDSSAFCQSITFTELDTTQLLLENGLNSAFNSRNLYDPLDNAWIQMTPDISQYRWEAYGRIARCGRSILSNTRDTKNMLTALGCEDTLHLVDEVEYDSEVPVSPNGHRVTVVRKESKTSQWNVNAGVGVSVTGVGHSHSDADYEIKTDFLDMNGDGYPDVVRIPNIQYTRPWGGLGGNQLVNTDAFTNKSKSDGNSISGTFPLSQKSPGPNLRDAKYYAQANGSVGVNAVTTVSYSTIAYVDINSDGLPDKLTRDGNGTVYACLNVGYGFAAPYAIPAISYIDRNHSICAGANAGVSGELLWENLHTIVQHILGYEVHTLMSKYQLSLTLGANVNVSQNNLAYRLVDMNGDGILDVVQKLDNGFAIALLSAQGENSRDTISNRSMQYSETVNGGLNVGATLGITFGWFKIDFGINGSPFGLAKTKVTHDLQDMNGDGLPDLVWTDNDSIHIRYNQSGKNLLLKKITNPTGQKYLFDYELSAPTYEQRGRQWQMSRVTDVDPYAHSILGCDTMIRTFTYADPHYDYVERQFLGYGTTTSFDVYTDSMPHTNYRKTIRRYNNRDFLEHGKLIYEGVFDADNHPFREYEIGTWYVDAAMNPTDNLCNDASARVGTEVHYTRYYEGGEDKIVTAKKYDYDRFYNVREYINYGDTILQDDELRATIAYDSTSIHSHNLLSLPVNMVVYNNETPYFEIQADYQDGLLTELRRTDLLYVQSDTSNYHYDSFGLPDSLILPANQNGERAFTTITYDAYSHTLPAVTSDQWGRTVQMTYDKLWQHPLIQKDISGDSLVFTYDSLGRVVALSVPGDTADNGTRRVSLTYSYLPRAELNSGGQYPFTQMKVFIRQSSLGNLQNDVYCDSRGNLMYRRELRDSEPWNCNWIFSNLVKRDCFGRPIIQYHNYLETNGTQEELTTDSFKIFSQVSHDVLDRPMQTRWQDGAQQTVDYHLGEDAFGTKRLEQVHTDERGGVSRIYMAPQGWMTTSIMPNHTKAGFTYNALGQLLTSIDPDSIITTYVYDGLGRKRARHHPDAGITQWQYDNAGNLIASATQAQLNVGTSTNYEYEYSRLKAIRQPHHHQLDVILDYDSIGRIANRKDITGCETFEYDALGNVAVSNRLMVLPSDTNGYRFRTEFTFDVLGRVQSIKYPDRERVEYKYHNANLYQVLGTKYNSAGSHVYATYPIYDSYNRPIEIWCGGYRTNFDYDVDRQWLTHQITQSNTHQLQDLYYTYDAVGNITTIEQQADSVHWLGGAYMLEYQYDSLSRLTRADMLSDYFGEYNDYSMTYSPSGMVGVKSCADMLWNYWYGYRKENNGLVNHQVRSIYDMENDATTFFLWDSSGRLRDIYNPCLGGLRHHWWNESDQLTAVADNGTCAFYGYDGNGERAYKLTGVTMLDQYNAGPPTFHMCFNSAVLYVNPYMVVTPKGYTKHYYNGSQRLAAHIGDLQDLPADIIDTSSVAIERIANARAYMDTLLLNQSIELSPDTLSSFADIDGDAYDELQWQCLDDSLIWNITMQCDSNMLLEVLTCDPTHIDHRIRGVYYYHPDHLGSATWITNSQGVAVEYLHYMPFGEMWYNQQGSAYNERFKFTGKERDVETGYDYFGARYYASAVLSWLSVDPLSDKYPNISPYAYCGWNPVMYIDPNGEENDVAISRNDSRTPQLLIAIDNFPENAAVIHVWAHGSAQAIEIGSLDYDEVTTITTPELFYAFLMNSSEIWQSLENHGNTIIVLHSCSTGAGENSIAEQISASPLFKNVLIVAPSKNIQVIDGVEYGPADRNNLNKIGAWKMFMNGALVNSFKGTTVPIFNNPEKHVRRYLK